jgi:hypothetical protein
MIFSGTTQAWIHLKEGGEQTWRDYKFANPECEA